MPFVQAAVLDAVANGYSGIFEDAEGLALVERAISLDLAARGPDARLTRAALLVYFHRNRARRGTRGTTRTSR